MSEHPLLPLQELSGAPPPLPGHIKQAVLRSGHERTGLWLGMGLTDHRCREIALPFLKSPWRGVAPVHSWISVLPGFVSVYHTSHLFLLSAVVVDANSMSTGIPNLGHSEE